MRAEARRAEAVMAGLLGGCPGSAVSLTAAVSVEKWPLYASAPGSDLWKSARKCKVKGKKEKKKHHRNGRSWLQNPFAHLPPKEAGALCGAMSAGTGRVWPQPLHLTLVSPGSVPEE